MAQAAVLRRARDGGARGGAGFHRVGPRVALGNDCRSRREGLASGLADLVLFLDLSMPNGLLPETKF